MQAVVITIWWLWQAVDLDDIGGTFTLFSQFNVGTVLIQWAIARAAFIGLNRWLASRSGADA